MGTIAAATRCHGRVAAVVIAIAGVMAGGCVTAGPTRQAVGSQAPATARAVVPAGGSPAEARAVGRRMLASLVLPTRSQRIAPRSQPPRSELIGGRNVIDVTRFYWLPMPENAALTFLRQHVPARTTFAGTGSGSDFHAVQYSLKAPPAGLEQFNMLLATLTADGDHGTLMRADAELTWYPPRSTAEYLPPAGYRSVTVTATFTRPSSSAHPRTITRVLRDQAAISKLARLLDGMHATAPWTGSCPAFLPQFRMVFVPRLPGSGRSAVMSVTPAGCRGELITTGGEQQPALEDFDSMRLLAVIGPLLGVRRNIW